MKRVAVSMLAVFTLFLLVDASPAALITDYLEFSASGISYDGDGSTNSDWIMSRGGGDDNVIGDVTYDFLKWRQSFTAPADYDANNINWARLFIEIADDDGASPVEDGYLKIARGGSTAWDTHNIYDVQSMTYMFDIDVATTLMPLSPGSPPVTAVDLQLGNVIGSDFTLVSSRLEIQYSAIPEPGSLILLSSGVMGLSVLRRRKE